MDLLLEGRVEGRAGASVDDHDEALRWIDRLALAENLVGLLGLQARPVRVLEIVDRLDATGGEAGTEGPEGPRHPQNENEPAMARGPRRDSDGPGGSHAKTSLSGGCATAASRADA